METRLETCEGCGKPFPAARLCRNERTLRLECADCYEEWRSWCDTVAHTLSEENDKRPEDGRKP